MIARIAALPGGRLLLPVSQRVGLGLIGLVDEQEDATAGLVTDIDVVTDMLDLPARGTPIEKPVELVNR